MARVSRPFALPFTHTIASPAARAKFNDITLSLYQTDALLHILVRQLEAISEDTNLPEADGLVVITETVRARLAALPDEIEDLISAKRRA